MSNNMKEEALDEKQSSSSSTSGGMMDLFVGNISLYTTETKLQAYFSTFGPVSSAKICTHPENGKNKRFGFLNFENEEVISKILSYPRHEIDGKVLEIRYASKNSLSRHRLSESIVPKGGSGGEESLLSKAKVFVGGVSQSASVEDLKAYFCTFGPVSQVSLLPDHITGRHRGFGFVTFQNELSAEVVCASRFHIIKMKKVECKKASLSRSLKSTPNVSSPSSSYDRNMLSTPQNFPDPFNKSPGLLGEHPWQLLASTGGFFLNPASYSTPTPTGLLPSYALSPLATPIIFDPLLSQRSAQGHSTSLKVLGHSRLLPESSYRYAPYILPSSSSRGSGETLLSAPTASIYPFLHHTLDEASVLKEHDTSTGGGGNWSFLPSRKL